MFDYKDKKVLVVGMGISGNAAALRLHSAGAVVKCTDISTNKKLVRQKAALEQKGIEIEIGGHTKSFYRDCELVVVSPGVPIQAAPIVWADRKGISVISEIELGYQFSASPIVAITGTNGKSTVTTMITRMLNRGGIRSLAAGNIGNPLTDVVQEAKRGEILVTETSSYQLERILGFQPFVSVILNISPDHLDRYISMEEYVAAKMRIFENQNEHNYVIVNENLRKIVEPFIAGCGARFIFFGRKKHSDITFTQNTIISNISDRKVYDFTHHFHLIGYHNIENLLAVIGVTDLFKVPQKAFYRALNDFKGLDHRIEYVDEIEGIKFVNDSKATNVDSVIKAIKAIDGPIILIGGGQDKRFSFRPLVEAAKTKVKTAVLIGEAAERMEKTFKRWLPVSREETLENAVDTAYDLAIDGDTVLLSPACASHDMFSGFEERGEVFKNKVRQLKTAVRRLKSDPVS